MYKIQEQILKVEELINQAAIDLVHEEASYVVVSVKGKYVEITQHFPCIFDCWWPFYRMTIDEVGCVSSFFGDSDYPKSKTLTRNIGFEKEVLKILKENL